MIAPHKSRDGYFLVECAICLATITIAATAFLAAMTAANQRTAMGSQVAVINAMLDNYTELYRAATPDRVTNFGRPLTTMPNNLFTVPTSPDTWSDVTTTYTSPISGNPINIHTKFMWTTPTAETGGLANGLSRVVYTLQIEMSSPALAGMTTTTAAAAAPMRFERSIAKTF